MSLLCYQKEIQEKGWDAYILPRSDEFFNAPMQVSSKERLAHLTGFTGSHGTLVITPKEVYLFTDGRYTLQAARQTEGIHIIDNLSPQKWLEENLSEKSTIAMDPCLISEKVAESYIHLVQKKRGTIVWDILSSLDLFLTREKEVSRNAISSMPADRSFQEKCALVFHMLSQGSAYLLCKGEDISWLTNLRGSDIAMTPLFEAYLLVNKQGDIFEGKIFTRLPRYLPHDDDPHLSFHPLEDFSGALENKTIYYDPSTTPYRMKSYPAQWEKCITSLPLIRSQKTPWEVHHMTQAHVHDGVALVRFLYWLSKNFEGETEYSVAQKLESYRRKCETYRGPSFPTISAFGGNGAIIHYCPTSQDAADLKEGLYLVDSGGQYHFGTTDVTRTVWLGDQPSLKHKKMFTIVLQAHSQLASLKFPPKVKGIQLDAAARSCLWQNGLDYAHSTGHGVGTYLSVHEYPLAISSRYDEFSIEEGMIFSNEPGYYEEGWGGIRLESLVAVVEKESHKLSLKTITMAPFDRKLILSHELSGVQRKWVNEYHEAVYKTLTPLLEEDVRQWLYNETRPLE